MARRWGVAFLIAAFLVSSKVFYYLFADQIDAVATGPERQASTQTASNNPLYLGLWLGLYIWMLGRLALQVLGAGLHPVVIRALPFAALALGSAAWSVSPQRTLLHATMLALNIAIAYVISQSLTPRDVLRLLRQTLLVLLALSLALTAFAPELATTPRFDGAWLAGWEMRGVFPFKTDAGWLFGLLFVLVVWSGDWTGGRAGRIGAALATLVGVLLSNSATGLACGASVLAILMLTRLLPDRVGPVLRTAFVGLVLLSLALPFIDIGWITGLLGRDPQLTGRVEIWSAATRFIAERPVLGFGYGGFFDPIPQSPVWEFWATNRDAQAPHFHSSSVETLIGLGAVGLIGYIYLLWSGFRVVYNRSLPSDDRIGLAGVLIFFLIGAAADTTFMSYSSFVTTMLFYCVFAAATHYPAAQASEATAPGTTASVGAAVRPRRMRVAALLTPPAGRGS